jgi:hypothetical protein
MWTAVSDLDYRGGGYDDEPETCLFCGAVWDFGEICEPDCPENAPAAEAAPAPVEITEDEYREVA